MEIKNVPVRGYRKTRIGIVTSDKMDKTVVVARQDQGTSSPLRQDGKPYPQSQGAR